MPSGEEIRALVGELRSSGGVGHTVETLEVFLLFPDEFRRRYAELCSRALKGAVEDQAGQAAEKESGLGRSRVEGKWKGKRVGAGAGGGGKRYKQFWTVRDENALRVKGKVDRRLRALARDIATGLSTGEEMRVNADGVTTSGRCARCGRYLDRGWGYCPTCGAEVGMIVTGRGDDSTRTDGVGDG